MGKIKNYKVFESTKSVEDICNRYNIQNWTLNSDGSIDVDGSVYLYDRELMELPIKFGRVTGHFDCSENKLTNLKGSPTFVGGDFDCSENKLTSLEGSPNWVGGNFYCWSNKLTSLIGGPTFVDVDFICFSNELSNLEGCPERVEGHLDCGRNNIFCLDWFPKSLGGRLLTEGNPIHEIWRNVGSAKLDSNHSYYLEIFNLYGPIQFEDGEWVCHVFRLNNFYEEIGAPPHKGIFKYYKVVD